MHAVAARETCRLPSCHASCAAHPAEETEIGYLFLLCHLLQQTVHIRYHGIGLPFAFGLPEHVAGSDEEDGRVRRTRFDILHLLAEPCHDSLYRARFLVEGDGVAAELHDDEPYVLTAVEIRQLRRVRLGEHQTEAAAHGDVIDDDSPLAFLRQAIDCSSALQTDRVAGECIMHGTVGKDLPSCVMRACRLRDADSGNIFAAGHQTVSHQRHLAHHAVLAVSTLHLARGVGQVALRTMIRVHFAAVHV